MGEQELIFEFLEMHLISFRCKQCGTTVIFDVRKTDSAVPRVCPGCTLDILVAATIHNAITQYRDLYHSLKQIEKMACFQLRVPAVSKEKEHASL